MADDPFKEASRYNTALRREKRRHQEATEREELNHSDRVLALRAALSPAAARIVVAAESEEPKPSGTCEVRSAMVPGFVVKHDGTGAYTVEEENPAPDWLNKEPAPLPAGSLLEVADKPARRRA